MFIRRCVICNKLIEGNNEYICKTCQSFIEKDFYNNYLYRCPNCYHLLLTSKLDCKYCKKNAFKIYSLADYKSSSKFILLGLKFYKRKDLAPLIGKLYYRELCLLIEPTKAAIIPIPCSKEGKKLRGYDQMDLICNNINLPTYKVLFRNDNFQQKNLNDQERMLNYENKFDLDVEKIKQIKEPFLFLIDDIYTTGFSMKAAFEIIKKNCNKEIRGFTWFSRPDL
ncbi:MAG: hypothetical protein WC162_05080 [Sphaerochaetaceae bacterium]|nr:hypothetical protein [Sphaerochaetaceae bacterium]